MIKSTILTLALVFGFAANAAQVYVGVDDEGRACELQIVKVESEKMEIVFSGYNGGSLRDEGPIGGMLERALVLKHDPDGLGNVYKYRKYAGGIADFALFETNFTYYAGRSFNYFKTNSLTGRADRLECGQLELED